MATLFRIQTLSARLPVGRMATQRCFHASARMSVKVGDRIPDVKLMESSPGNSVSMAKEIGPNGRGLIIGVPAAFSPACSASHVPSYIKHSALKGAGKTFVVSVNDAFVMKAWGDTLDQSGQSGIRFLADPHADFTKAVEMDFDGSAIFGNARSKRYALVVEDGKVKSVHVEPDNTGTDVSMAGKVLG